MGKAVRSSCCSMATNKGFICLPTFWLLIEEGLSYSFIGQSIFIYIYFCTDSKCQIYAYRKNCSGFSDPVLLIPNLKMTNLYFPPHCPSCLEYTDDLSENQGVMDNRNQTMLKISTYRRHGTPQLSCVWYVHSIHCTWQAKRQESPEVD